MSTFYVVGEDVDKVKEFFSTLPEDERPRVVSDKDHPAVWDHPSDDATVIVTDTPRTDTDASELVIDGKQPNDIMAEIKPEESLEVKDLPQPPTEEGPVKGPRTFSERGFKVGRIS